MKRIYPIPSAQSYQIRVIRYHSRNSPMTRLFFMVKGYPPSWGINKKVFGLHRFRKRPVHG